MLKENYMKLDNEDYIEYGIRLIKEKMEDKPDDLNWQDIVDLLGLKVHRDTLRKACQTEFGSYNIIKYFNENYVSKKKDENDIKVLIINDLHLPYVHAKIYEVIEQNKDVDYILIAGDLLDCKSCSFFEDFNKPNVEDELIIAHEFLTKVNDIINPDKTKIIAIRGNHEYRFTKNIMSMQEKQLQKLLNPNLLAMIETGFTIYDKNKDIYYKPIENFQYIDDFYTKMFDNLIITHPLDFSGTDGRMCEKVADYFLNEHIAEQDDVVVFAHTHKFSQMKVNRRQGLFVVENGCLCQPHKYSKMGKLSYTPQNYCYTRVSFKKGQKINLNDIEVIHLD